jgi:membrane-associated phospholipid phosphatase|tara:strand:+ start:15273 stop:15872 length:600 start_codon:yes stop_codon:yes gene_type:complete
MFFSKVLSKILHPIFIHSIVIAIVIKEFLNILILPSQAPFVLITSILFTLLLPLISVCFFLLTGKIQSLEMLNKEERLLPLFMSILWMILGYIIMNEVFMYNPTIKSIYLGAIYTLVVTTLITIKWKISLHMIGIGGAVGVFLALQILYGGLYSVLLLSIFFSGLLAYARLELKAHNTQQVYCGFMLSLLVMIINVLYL